MAIDVKQLEAKFQDIARTVDVEGITKKAQKVVDTQLVSLTSKLGKFPDEVVGGFKSLTQELDDIQENLEASIPNQLFNKPAIAQLTSELPGLAEKVIKKVGPAASDIQAMTGSLKNAADGFLDVVVAQGTPDAIAAALKTAIPDAKIEEIQNVVKEGIDLKVPLGQMSADLKSVGKTLGELGNDFKKIAPAINSQIQSTLKDVSNVAGSAEFRGALSQAQGALREASNVLGSPGGLPAFGNQIQSDLKNVTNALAGQSKTLTGALDTLAAQAANFEAPLTEVVNQFAGAVPKLDEIKNDLFSTVGGNIQKALGGIDQGLIGSLSNIIEDVEGPLQQALNSVSKIGDIQFEIPADARKQIGSLISAKNFDGAVEILQGFSDKSAVELNSLLKNVDLSAAGNLLETAQIGGELIAKNLGDLAKGWSGANTASNFRFAKISTVRELILEFKGVQREVTELIVHWTETYRNQDIGAKEIQRLSAQNGDGIPYHYLIRRDGSIERGRPLNEVGGTLANGHEQNSIQIAFVGGIDAPTGATDIQKFLSKKSLTRAQFSSFDIFLAAAYTVWPGLQALGHKDIDRKQVDPGFDVEAYVESKFRKRSVVTDPAGQGPVTKENIRRNTRPRSSTPPRPTQGASNTGENGRLDINNLQTIGGVSYHRLRSDAATAYDAMAAAAARDGITWTITDSYRDYATQVRLAEEKGLYSEGGLAARPGTSNHGWGLAVDLGGGANRNGTPQNNWLRENANRFGFYTIPREPWHWEYRG